MKQVSLIRYVIAVVVVMAAILAGFAVAGNTTRLHSVAIFFAGFLLGMLAMFIAVHVYAYK